MSTRLVAVDVDPKRGVMLHSDFTLSRRHVGLPHLLFFPPPSPKPGMIRSGLAVTVRYDLVLLPQSILVLLYNTI